MNPRSAIGVVRDALERAGCDPRGSEERFRARCPAHDDRHPSLDVREGHEGRALLICRTGCNTQAIVGALGLELGDLFGEPRERTRTQAPIRAQDAARLRRTAAEDVLERLCRRFGPHAYRATSDRRAWIGRCPACEQDRLVIVEDDHDPILDPDDAKPRVRFSCMGANCTPEQIASRMAS